MSKSITLQGLEGIKRFVIVVGCQRSGTTLLGQVIGAQSGCVLIDEFEGLYPWFHAVADQSPDAQLLTTKVIAQARDKYSDDAGRFVAGGAALDGSVETLVLKAPNLTFEAAKIANLGLPVHVIYPVRDPRAVVASMLRLKNINFVENQRRFLKGHPEVSARYQAAFDVIDDEDAPLWERAAKVWMIKSDLAQMFVDQGLQVLQFTYEDFVAAAFEWTDKIRRFCDLNDAGTACAHEGIYKGQGPGGTDRQRPVDATSLGHWQQDLDAELALGILTAAQPVAARFGYDG
ncbi:MAG: sulfotransferase [Sulfitobacter sp.]